MLASRDRSSSEEWLNSLFDDVCNPNTGNRLSNDDLARMEDYARKFVAEPYVYTPATSIEEPFTEKVRKSMVVNVKRLAYADVLDRKIDGPDGQFFNGDEEIFNYATDVFKNSSVQKPAWLNKPFSTHVNSIGQIARGSVNGTCFLVTDTLVITCYHVYKMILATRETPENSNLPITVSFDYFRRDKRELVLTVEVDEKNDPKLESQYLDYKFLKLKESDHLRDRVPLGPIVRNRELLKGRVIIIGHPKGKELREEVCRVVRNSNWGEKVKQRHAQVGVHLINGELLHKVENHEGCLPYETSLFSGSSGSPVFDKHGNIVAMHAQGYLLEKTEPGGNSTVYSAMEFGVQFHTILRDMIQRHGEATVNRLFPNYILKHDEEHMDQSQQT